MGHLPDDVHRDIVSVVHPVFSLYTCIGHLPGDVHRDIVSVVHPVFMQISVC